MVRIHSLVVLFSTSVLFAASAATASERELPQSYVGVTAGALTPKYFRIEDGTAINAGIGFGLRLRELQGVAVEAIWTGSAIRRSAGEPGPSDNISTRTSALFGVYRSPGQPYIKGRLGISRVTTFDETSNRTRNDFAGGVGIGWQVPEGALEVEQSFFNPDAWFVSVSYFYDLY